MASNTPSGWYPDPSGEDELRWWDGQSWTATTSSALAAGAPSRTRRDGPRLGALLAFGGLLLVTAGVVAAAIFMTGRDRAPETATEMPLTDGSQQEEPAGNDDDPDESESAPPEGDRTPGDEGEDVEESGGEEASDETATIDFDGVCTVQLDESELDEDPRPWSFPECTSAPVELSAGQERWIVVVSSLSDADFAEADARERVQEGGLSDDVLYSSHYPSLNPGLWVVYAGPFDGEDDARAAAEEIGGGSYPRVLSDDDQDRYCIAADGCVGQRDSDD